MKRIELVVHPKMPLAMQAAGEIAHLAEKRGLAASESPGGQPPDIVVALGGDGTILRAAGIARNNDVGLIGMNFGKLGFLSTAEPEHLADVVDAIADENFVAEDRMMIDAVISRNGEQIEAISALNEVVVERGTLSRVVSVRVTIGDELVATYIADGFIVSTPSGSTAYSLSAGGPVLEPQLVAMVLTAVSAHAPLWRSIVVGPKRPVHLETPKDHVALSADGRAIRMLDPGSSVVVTPSAKPLRLISLKGIRFYDRLRSRFNLNSEAGQ